MKNYNAQVSISRVTSTKNPDGFIRISIIDDTAAIIVTEIDLSLEDFSKAVTGQSYISARGLLGSTEKVGKKLETKKEIVVFPISSYPNKSENEAVVRETIARHEVDGWIGNDKDAYNHHQWIPGASSNKANQHAVKISFRRWV